ncbi:MAG: transglutaminase protein [Solirubrobacterales bacterium]|jgi:transglutaminase-like putative cysteine protease|nr:transglutaminase protein [Solirubrobacterales bacterium]
MDHLPEYGSDEQRDADLLRVDFLDHDTVDWSRLRRTTYRVQQRFRYEYAGPISALRQRLMVVPRPVHGDQRLLCHELEVSEVRFRKRICGDRFGNVVLEINIPKVEEVVDFDVSVLVERLPGRGQHLERAKGQALDVYRLPSALTRPDSALRAAAVALACSGETGGDLAAAVSSWVYRRMSYGFDRTGVHTTAGEALAAGQGVCQDYAHVMLALCRLLDIPARYVSGHLVGEGGTHAWVEVLLPGPGQSVEVHAWDPTHDRRADLKYLTVAVGRDYRDVAPVSGTYRLPHQGWLSASCRVGVAQLEHEIAA